MPERWHVPDAGSLRAELASLLTVGRTPWSAAGALAGLFTSVQAFSSGFRESR